MKRYFLILITGCLLAAMSGPVSALPAAQNSDCSDTSLSAYDAFTEDTDGNTISKLPVILT